MEWWQILLLAVLIALLVLAAGAFLLWRKASETTRAYGERLERLPWRLRIELAWRLVRDDRVPIAVRAIPPLLVLYLAMPLDLIPDIIPILGQLDDVLVVIVAIGLITRFVPLYVVDAHLRELEAEARDES